MEVFLIRHTTPDVAPGVIYGRMDVSLASSFPAEVSILKQKLPASFDVVYASPAGRCTQLAVQLASRFVTDNRLYELNFGDWEGKTWDSIHPDESKAWMDDFVNVCTPGGESLVQMNDRVLQFWDELHRRPAQRVALVTHGGVIRLLVAGSRGIPLASIFDIQVKFGDVFRGKVGASDFSQWELL